MNNHPPCLAWREKIALRYEDLSPLEQQALNAHLRICAACSAALADYHFFEARLDALPPPAIMPLPRLSPHFFEQLETTPRDDHSLKEQEGFKSPCRRSTPTTIRHPYVPAFGRALASVAVICLLLVSALLFHFMYQTRLATHPNGNTLLNLNQHTDLVAAVAWSPDGRLVATASWDHTVKVWNAQNGELLCTYFGHSGEIYALAWSPNGQKIASASNDNTVQVWDPTNCSTPFLTYTGHSGAVYSVAWSPDGLEIISGSWDHTARIWNALTGKTLQIFPFTDVVSSVAWAHNGQNIAIGDWNEYVQIIHQDTSSSNWKTLQKYRDNDAVNAVAWSPNDIYLASGNQDGTLQVRDVVHGRNVWTNNGHNDAVNAVAWSPDGTEIASGSDDKTVRIWNPFTRKMLMLYNGHTATVSSVAWSPDSRLIISGSFDDTAKIWKVTG